MNQKNCKRKIIYIDLDGTLCIELKPYKNCKPILKNILKINELYKNNYIVIWTARRVSDRNLTLQWLKKFNVKFHKLILGKPKFDIYIDEKEKLEGW